MDTHDLQPQKNANVQRSLVDEGMCRRAAEEFDLELGVRDGDLHLSQRKSKQWGIALVALSVAAISLLLPKYLPDLGLASDAVRLTATAFAACLFVLAAYLPFAAVDVSVSRRRIERVRRWAGVSLKKWSVPSDAVVDLSIDRGRSGAIGRSYDLIGRGEFGRLKLLDDIPDREFLDAIRRQIMLSAGLRPSGTH